MIKERIIELMRQLNMSPTQFANQVGVQRATLQHILNGRNEPSLKLITAIHTAYPNIELKWLIDGEGSPNIHILQPNDVKEQDMPLFPGMESTFFPSNIQEKSEFSNLKGQNGTISTKKKAVDKDITSKNSAILQPSARRVKEVVIFFDDGTFQKFSY